MYVQYMYSSWFFLQGSHYQLQLRSVRDPISVMVLNTGDKPSEEDRSMPQTLSEATPQQTSSSTQEHLFRPSIQTGENREDLGSGPSEGTVISSQCDAQHDVMSLIDSASIAKLMTELGEEVANFCTCMYVQYLEVAM